MTMHFDQPVDEAIIRENSRSPSSASRTNVSPSEHLELGQRIELVQACALRQEPAGGAAIVGELPARTEVTILAARPGWAWVQNDQGLEGWMESPVKSQATPAAPKQLERRSDFRWVGWALFGGVVLVIILVVATAGGPKPNPTVAIDGERLTDQAAETQAMFRETWGDQADRQWVIEHNASLPPPAPIPPTIAPAPTLARSSLPRTARLSGDPSKLDILAATSESLLVKLIRATQGPNPTSAIGALGDQYGRDIVMLYGTQTVTVEQLDDVDAGLSSKLHVAQVRLATGADLWVFDDLR